MDESLEAGELALIRRLRRRAAGLPASAALRLGIGDDCAILQPQPGSEIVVTTDFSLEGRHFRRDWHIPEAIGHRILARGISDLAAMGATPVAAFLSLAIPKGLDTAWLDRVFDGLFALAEATATPLAGGDTAESPTDHMLADITLLGQVPAGKALRRDAGRPGDRLFVTGFLGGSAAELSLLAAMGREPAAARAAAGEPPPHPHLFPSPRLRVGEVLLQAGLAHACMDLSDGLSSDLHRMCEASGLAAVVRAERLPLHPLARTRGEEGALALALHGGEDYELLFSAAPDAEVPDEIAGVPITEIGSLLLEGDTPVMLVDVDGQRRPLRAGGWEHLR